MRTQNSAIDTAAKIQRERTVPAAEVARRRYRLRPRSGTAVTHETGEAMIIATASFSLIG
jgi:hypothetical protein